eukprot:gene20938-27786_t
MRECAKADRNSMLRDTGVMENAKISGGAEPAPDHQLGFAVLCVQKALEFSITDHKLHRATKDKELHEELEKLTNVEPSTYFYQLGGGCRIIGPTEDGDALLTSACVGDSVAAFKGSLSNLQELAQMYVPEPEKGSGQATPAEVICHMYLEVGVDLLTKLRGRFVFCMYESKQGRVLAARDGSGEVDLYQGHSPNEGLVIASTLGMLQSCTDARRTMEQSNGYRGSRGQRGRSIDFRKTSVDLHGKSSADFKAAQVKTPQQSIPVDVSKGRRRALKDWGRGAKGDAGKLDTRCSSFCGSVASSAGSSEKLLSSSLPSQMKGLSMISTLPQMKGLSIDAPAFRPTFGSPAPVGTIGPCGGTSPVMQTIGAPTIA